MKIKIVCRIFSFALAAALAFGIVGCGSTEAAGIGTADISPDVDPVIKGTDVGKAITIEGDTKTTQKSGEVPASMGTYGTDKAVAGEIAQEAEEALEAALTGTEYEGYKALTCFGKQIVAGINYHFIGVFNNELYTAKVYHPFSDKDELTECTVYDLTACLAKEADPSEEAPREAPEGGWIVPEESNLSAMPQDLASSMSALSGGGYSLKILAVLGSKQADGGNDYVLLCRNMSAENGGLYVAELTAKELGGGGTLSAIHPFSAEQ